MQVLEMPDALLRDVRYAIRALRRQPGFVTAVIATFALAIGTNAAMLGVVTMLMLAPPRGIGHPDRVVHVQVQATTPAGESYAMATFSYPTFQAFERADRAFGAVAAARFDTVMVGRPGDLRPAATVQGSGKYFAVLEASPALGHFFGPADDQLPLGNSVVVLSHAFWTRRFARDPAAIGRELVVDGQPFTIIGVAQPGFNGDNLAPVDLFLPLSAGQRSSGAGWWTREGMNIVGAVARLAPTASAPSATSEATRALHASSGSSFGMDRTARLKSVVPGRSARETPQSRIALWLSGVSLIVLLIATANVGTLLLLRAARRRRETSVRIALGATRTQLGRQLLIESLILAISGAAAGLVLSRWFGDVLRVTLLPTLAPDTGFVDGRVLAISVVAASVAGLLASLAPLTQIGSRNLSAQLRAAGEPTASSRLGYQSLLVGVQVALCTVLLVGAGLFVRSLERVQSQNLGFSTAGLLVVSLDFQGDIHGKERDLAHDDALRRIRGVIGVKRATVVEAMPFGSFHVPPMSVPGHQGMPTLGGQPPFMYGATPEFLDMMGVRVRSGRLFTDADTHGSRLVVLVNESMARTLWPGESALGKCVRAGYPPTFQPEFDDPMEAVQTAPCREVVGVVANSRARSLRPDGNEARQMQYYVPFGQIPAPPVPTFSVVNELLVQVSGDPDRIAAAVQRAAQTGATVPVYARVRTYQDLLDPQLRSWRLGATLFSAFSALALAIAAVGLLGVISYVVTQRTREIGVRIAIGASRAVVWRMIVRDAVRLVVVGLIAGGVIAMAGAPLIRDLLFQTSPWEPANLAVAVGILLTATVVAALWPAWKASRVDPLLALRADG